MNESTMTWLEAKNGGTLVRLRIQPKASRTEIVGLHGVPPRLKIRIAAPPVDGAANEEVLRFLKKLLGAPTLLVRGEKSKDKDVLCVGLTHEAVERILLPGSAPTSN